MAKSGMTYSQAGVDIARADRFLDKVDGLIKSTRQSWQVGGIGGFSGLFRLPRKGADEPVLAATTDGVGTKLLIAHLLDKHDTIGIDLVAMCVNDLITCGAKPLIFLDYFATGNIRENVGYEILKGISEGCRQAECALIGGETAEMPGLYGEGHYDLAGFAVGVVAKSKLLTGRDVRPGDILIGLASSGAHSNGYSLVRKVFSEDEIKSGVGKKLLTPTIIYVRPLMKLFEKGLIKSAAHITGGGLQDNVPRSLGKRCSAVIDRGSWPVPDIFKVMQEKGGIENAEMYHVFNMGIGMVVILKPENEARTRRLLDEMKVRHFRIGQVVKGKGEVIF
ncbi:MAG TPA: phosphoribosylformylglycinamidine cyclo-ligase [Candidatus Brocadiia bacterium]|nr:phosphoribosylformylglycinamidine cyclo-ligase [Candidatus Brocadiia bacterium]